MLERRFCSLLVLVGLCGLTGSLGAQIPGLSLSLSSEVGVSGEHALVDVVLENTAGNTGGYSFGVCHGSGSGVPVASVEDVAMGLAVATSNAGNPPDFHDVQVYPGGFTVGVVISSGGFASLPPGVDLLYTVTYDLGNSTGTVPLEFCETLGTPSVAVCLFIPSLQATCADPALIPGSIEVVAELPFVRGDCNQDSTRDLADAIYLELYLFVNGAIPGCLDACDHNDDGQVDIADSITLLMWLFSGGPELPAPVGICGFDPSPDDVGCLFFGAMNCP